MTAPDLKELATRARSMRETGIALIVASGVLAALLFVPLSFKNSSPPALAVATSTPPSAFDRVHIEAKAAVVYDLVTGEVLYAKNADAQLPLASLTKLLTVYAALSQLAPTTPITISENVARTEAPRAFNVGQTLSLSDLARLTLVASLNDGAAAIAEATALRENKTPVEALAGAAAALGLSQTYAVNGSGLDVSTSISGAYGSATDLARLAGALVEKNPVIAAATTLSIAEATTEGGTTFKVKNTNPMTDTLPRLLLSKTGFTDLAGGNLALVFDAGIRHPIAVVVLGSTEKSRFTDGSALIAASFAYFAGVDSL